MMYDFAARMFGKPFRIEVLPGVLGVALISAGASAQPGAKPLEFEVASIHANRFSRGGWQAGNGTLRGSGSPASLVGLAYAIDDADNIVGLPDWTLSTYYDIQAKATGSFSREQTQEMERSLLAQRFRFSAHWTSGVRSGYALRRVARSAKIPPISKDDGSPLDGRGAVRVSATGVSVHHATMGKIALVIELLLRQPVKDETGLAGGYEFDLVFERPNPSLGADGEAFGSGPSIFTALRSVGLELDSGKMALKILNVDSISRPSEN